MSNLAGSYKVGVGDVQGVDLREQERRARQILLTEIREPSPQPIFGEPVKVELEDETSLRIKNTLGEVENVIIHDPKSLIGIPGAGPVAVFPPPGHPLHPSYTGPPVCKNPTHNHQMSSNPSQNQMCSNPSHNHQMAANTNSHQMPGNPSNSHQMPGNPSNSHQMPGNPSNSHPMSGHSSNSHSMSGHHPSSHSMPRHSSNSHLVSSHQINPQLLSGHQSNPFSGHQTIAHSIAGHHTNTHPIAGHPSNIHPMTGHPASTHPTTNAHIMSGHTSSSHPITGHPSNSHSLTGHSNSHLTTGHPINSHSTTGINPSNIHPIPGHTTGGLPSNGYHITGHPVNVHPISGHPSNGHPISSYAATGYSGAGHAPSRPQAASKKVLIPANNPNVLKPANPNLPNMYPKIEPDKRNSYNRQRPDSPVSSKPLQTSSFNSVERTQNQVQPHYHAQDNKLSYTEQKKSSNPPFSVNVNFSGGNYNTVTIGDINVHSGPTSCAPIFSCGPETPAIQVTPFHLPPCTPSTANRPTYNLPRQNEMAPNMQKFDVLSDTSPVKRPVNRPSHLKIERKPTSPIGVETILKEMTKPVPAPLTAIQTPRTEETGFAFPPEPKEESMVVKIEEKANPSNVPPEEKSYICQPSPQIVKSVSPFPNLQSQHQLQTSSVAVKIENPEPMVTDYTSSLQDDLEMSESDEEAVPEEKKEDASECLPAPSNPVTVNTSHPPVPVSSNNNMETNSASSSSSESGDSDSDDDSSESNNSDSSSESSDEDASSMKWGLSNFVDESRRNHSPAFRSLEMQKQLNSAKPVNNVGPLIVSPPVSQALSGFIVADTPVTARSEILSPIRSPAPHPVVGPRTPPSPSSPIKDLSEEDKCSSLNDSKSEPLVQSKSSDSLLDTSIENETLLPSTSVACDENKEISSSASSEILSSEVGSSPLNRSITEDKVELKDTSKSSSEKDTSLSEAKSSPISSDALESSSENYSIKTRQKGATSVKKTKLTNVKKVINNKQNDDINSPPIAKFKHPRACRKSTEKLATSPAKPEQLKEPPKKRLKQAVKPKEVHTPEKNKPPLKSTISPKKPTKASIKQKGKVNKATSKINTYVKKGDLKTKKKKFVVENFLQSPTSNNETDLAHLHSPSPSLDDLPLSDIKKQSDAIDKLSNSSTSTVKGSAKNATKANSKTKAGEKLRRSARCSERASSLSQSEPSTTPKQSAELSTSISQVETSTPKSGNVTNKKSQKKLVKSKPNVENLPIPIDPPLQILSPIPHESPIASTSEQSSRKKIMVSIPLSKLLRIPSILHQIQELNARLTSKSSTEDIKLKKDLTSKNPLNKSSQAKDFKEKPRTDQVSKNCKKNVSKYRKDNTKSVSESASKNVSSVNKNSAKVSDKAICDVENKLPKKRKSEGDSKQAKKKPKLSSLSTEEKKSKEQHGGSKVELAATQNDGGGKSKPLERCDSTSSLSSLSSQRSSKSSKEKKDSVIHESKRLKTSAFPAKEIKQEKEDRTKVHIKKEPISALDKPIKSRDKSSISDIDCNEKGEAWNENPNSSSQYGYWGEECKDESKKEVPSNSVLDSAMDYGHHYSMEHKDLKEPSVYKTLTGTDKFNIMAMDYYWTEGKSMKKSGEMEKDPFKQAVKFFEAAVLFVLTSQQNEENNKNPDSVYQFYYETLQFTSMMLAKIKKLQSCPGSTEFKLLILCLKCQSLLNVKLYSLKIKEIKEQIENCSEFFRAHCSPIDITNPNLPSLYQSRVSSLSTVSSPHSVIPPSPNSASSQISGYVSGDIGKSSVSVPQKMLDILHRQHNHLKNLHMGHDLWEQADMYMTRSNLKEFFKEVADQSEPLTLHSTVKELVSYMQKCIIIVKKTIDY